MNRLLLGETILWRSDTSVFNFLQFICSFSFVYQCVCAENCFGDAQFQYFFQIPSYDNLYDVVQYVRPIRMMRWEQL